MTVTAHNNLQDIFEAGFTARKVWVIGPGPSAADFDFNRIANTDITIALNKGIELPHDFDLWTVIDTKAIYDDWFKLGMELHADISCFGPMMKGAGAIGRYEFQYFPLKLKPDDGACVEGKIRSGGTVAAAAVQLAYHFGAEEIVLVGVDFTGSNYDGTPRLPDVDPASTIWATSGTPRINALIKWIDSQGVNIYAVADTNLEVRVENGIC